MRSAASQAGRELYKHVTGPFDRALGIPQRHLNCFSQLIGGLWPTVLDRYNCSKEKYSETRGRDPAEWTPRPFTRTGQFGLKKMRRKLNESRVFFFPRF